VPAGAAASDDANPDWLVEVLPFDRLFLIIDFRCFISGSWLLTTVLDGGHDAALEKGWGPLPPPVTEAAPTPSVASFSGAVTLMV